MTFAAPLFLLAALAAAIPVMLHMINRQKAKELPFSTLRFLKISVQKTRRRKRIHDVLLMLLRASMLLLIAAGLAKPAVTNLSSLWGGAHAAAVIILDNSASMGMIDQDRVRFETATAAAAQILEQLTDGDQVAILPTNGRAFPDSDKLDRSQETARQVLAQCRVSYERANLAAKVRHARALLAESEAPNRHIFVLTDMQKLSWEGMGGKGRGMGDEGRGTGDEVAATLPSPNGRAAGGEGRANNDNGHAQPQSTPTLSEDEKEPATANSPAPSPSPPIPLIIVDCNRTPKPNVAVQGVDLQAAVPVAGLPVKATVTLLNTSIVPRQPRVELIIDNMKEASSPELSAPPEGRVKHDFQFTFKRGGLHRGEVRLVGEDGSKYDDRRFFAMEVDQGIPVAVVKAQRHEIPYLDDSYYLEQALAPGRAGGAIVTTTLTAGDLLSEPLEKYKVVFCVNLPAPDADAAERLRAYVAGGGHLVWIAGDNVNAEAYNQMNEQARSQLLPAPLLEIRSPRPEDNRDSWHISFLDKKHPALNRLVEPASLYESVLVYKHVRMTPAEGDESRVLARLDDGEPLLVEKKAAKGKVLMLGTSAHVSWSNLPLRPIFLPLVSRLTFDLAEVEQTWRTAIAGQPLVLQFAEETQPLGVEVIPPSGETLRLKTEGKKGEPGQTFRYADTHDIGIYLLRLLDAARSTQIAYCVNSDPDEAEPAKLDRKELQSRVGDAPLVFAENPDDLSSTFALLREGKSLWGAFLVAVLVGLVFETFVSNRLSPKQDEQAAHQPPPGMRRLAQKGK